MSGLFTHKDRWIAAGLLALSFGYYFYSVMDTVTNARTWVDEVTYLVKSYRYVTGQVNPYTATDPTWYMPLYFYELGLWQKYMGAGMTYGRLLSAGIGALSGIVIFDIVRRVTGNWTASAIATATLFTVPAVVFYFGTATPISTVSLLCLLAVWMVVIGVSRPTQWRSLCLGVLFGVLYFYRQNMILVLVALLPVYILGLRQNRANHFATVLIGIAIVAAPILLTFPDRLLSYAIRLPLITPLLSNLNLINDPITLIQTNTTGAVGLNLAFSKFVLEDLLDAYLLPYAGLILAAGAVVILAPEGLRILWVAPLIFFFLSATHYVGSLDYCQTCILPYTASYAGIGALCAGLAVSVIAHVSKDQKLPSWVLIGLFAVAVIAYNQSASSVATRDEYRFYPQAMLSEPRPIPERVETEQLAAFLRENTDPTKSILPVHDLVTVPYALFLADRRFPVQGLNLRHSYRVLTPGLSDSERQITYGNLEREGLWADETLDNWIAKAYDTIVYQVDPRDRDSNLEATIGESFARTASTGFRGWNVHVYQRRPVDTGLQIETP
ncbi:MAG: glycosyltransferase family 39 protein [Rhodospirillaceae bacterium]|jgi:hypothetical protein|nr:glycosyltransferase family 39 protein [Rhodospirillaceae bacterium]